MKESNPLLPVNFERSLNIFGFLGVISFSAIVIIYQLISNQLPCPLCFLQRAAFLSMALGFLLNIRFGLRPSHYTIILLSGFLTTLIALRIIALTDLSDSRYLSLLFGFHLATWAFGIGALTVVLSAVLLGLGRKAPELHSEQSYWKAITSSLCGLLASILFINMVLVALQCGLAVCPKEPTGYHLLHHIRK